MDIIIIAIAQYFFLFPLLGVGVVLVRLPSEERRSYLLTIIAAGIVAVILTQFAALLYFDPRPFTHGIHALIPHAADNGFPSDHTVLSVVAAALVFHLNKRMGSALLVIALAVGISRVAAGVHSPIDIVAGVLIGLISVWLGTKVQQIPQVRRWLKLRDR